MKCSICKEKEAVNESRFKPGTYYCSSCANYVAMEYGMSHLKPLPENIKSIEKEGELK